VPQIPFPLPATGLQDHHTVSRPSPERPTLAVLLDNMFEGYESDVWHHMSEAARAEDANLLCFLAGPARGQRLQRVVYDLPSREIVDGIVGLFGTINMGKDEHVPPAAGTIGWDANAPGCFSQEEAQAFLQRYGGLPVVSIGKLIAGVPTILVDNEVGVEAVASHLVEVHGRRRIAFVQGPDGNEEAEARLRGYRRALERHGLPFDPALLCPGDFTFQAGPQAVRELLDERRVAFDALVAANDIMAIEAMRELQRRGVRVPEAVAVVGFDDLLNAASVTPALTTVSQPLRDLGGTAVRQVLAMIRGGAVPERSVLPTRPVYRRSCGCMGAAEHGWSVPALPAAAQEDPRPAWSAGVARALVAADPWLETLPGGGGAAALVEALCAELEGTPGFVEALDAAVSAGLGAGVPPLRWRSFVLGVFEAVRRRLQPDGERLLALLSRANALLGERAEQAESLRTRELEYEAFVLQQVFRVTGVEEHEFTAALRSQLPKLGVTSLYLARMIDPAALTAKLAYHYAVDDVVALDDGEGPYPARRLVPGRFTKSRRWTYVVMPLHFGAEVTGFAVCAAGAMRGSTYEALANQLGRAFKASTLLQEVRQHAAELETRVEERARQLRAAQAQLVEVAHQAGMAEIAVGALHNVGNLLNSISISAEAVATAAGDRVFSGLSRLEELLWAHRADLPGFFAADARAALVPEYCRQLARALEDDRRRIRTEAAELQANVVLVRETIAALQEYAREGQDDMLVERIDPAVLLEAALKLQATHIARHHVQVRRRLEPVAPALVQRFKVVHVLVNVIKNAVEAMQRVPEADRVLTVELSPRPGAGAILRIADTGEGIPADALERLFSYGFTTKPEGHGFGLHTCANYLHQMGGHLVAESEGPGRGARFTLELPG
jgi:signal transduction histidine kinase